jgi:membrane-bound metal-dependent hydrolase YbcI (DUF457 family)
MGPALALKAGADRRFSILTFGFAQIAMDIEPLIGMLRGSPVLHGFTHTYAGATLIALAVAWLAPFLCTPILRRYNREVVAAGAGWLSCSESLSRQALLLGAFIGTFSHVLLDSLMHADMQPFWPLSAGNPLLGLLPWQQVYRFCFWLGMAGAVAWLLVRYRRRAQSG